MLFVLKIVYSIANKAQKQSLDYSHLILKLRNIVNFPNLTGICLTNQAKFLFPSFSKI